MTSDIPREPTKNMTEAMLSDIEHILLALTDTRDQMEQPGYISIASRARIVDELGRAIAAINNLRDAESSLRETWHDDVREADILLAAMKITIADDQQTIAQLVAALREFVSVCDSSPPLELVQRIGAACDLARTTLANTAQESDGITEKMVRLTIAQTHEGKP